MTFSSPMEKPKPFLVYKPGFEGKMMKSGGGQGGNFQQTYGPGPGQPMMMLVNQPPLSSPPTSGQSQQYHQLFQHQGQQQLYPQLSPISMAHQFVGGPSKAALLEKSQSEEGRSPSPYNHLLPIGDLEGNDINSGPLVPSQVMPPFESQRTSGTSGQGPSPYGREQGLRGLSQPGSPVSYSKQMTINGLAQQRSHILNAHSAPNPGSSQYESILQRPPPQGPSSLMMMPMNHQQMMSPGPSSSNQGQSPYEQSLMNQQQQMSPKMRDYSQQMQLQHQSQMIMDQNGPSQQQMMSSLGPAQSSFQQGLQQGLQQGQFQQGPSPQPSYSDQGSSKLRYLDQTQGGPQASRFQMPEPQVTSSIIMPQPKGKTVDPRQELQDQINFVLQNSPNLSEGSRGRHRDDIYKAVQESLADSDNSNSRPAIVSSNFNKVQSRPSNMALGSGLSIDGLVGGSQQRPESSSSFEGGPRGPSAYYPSSMTTNYKGSSSRLAPEPSYFSRYNQENAHPFSPMEGLQGFSSGSNPIHPGTYSGAQATAALSQNYKAKLQQEITRYLSDQMVNEPATSAKQNEVSGNFLSGQGGPVFSMQGMNPNSYQHSSSMLKYASSPLRKVASHLVERQNHHQPHQPSSSALLLDSQPARSNQPTSGQSNQPHHFILGRQTEFVQSQASQQSRTEVKAPEGAASTKSTSTSSTSSSPYTSLLRQLSMTSVPSAEVAKTLRGYSEWWKESAAASARPIVVHQLTNFSDQK